MNISKIFKKFAFASISNTKKKPKNFYITTTLPYVNASPHVGFAMEIIRADAIARFKQSQGCNIFFNTGTDEHGQKIFQNAQKEGVDTQAYVDGFAEKFRGLKTGLNLLPEIKFIRTTDEKHVAAAQEFWKRCNDNGFIYKKDYQIKYCVGCELEKTDSELVNGRCPIHTNQEIEEIHEENYFFKFSEFQNKLLDLYKNNPHFVEPDFRFNEIKSFVERGLKDFSISRVKEKMPWGIPVPGDDTQVMYVWFDALVNYISTLDWPEEGDGGNFEKFWKNGEAIQIAGKDNLRQQSAMWQAMLLAAGLPTSDKILINGFINSGGQKMSKSLGNVISPIDVVAEFGSEAIRYYLLRHMHQYEDSDMTMDKFKEAYNANLANGIGNLASRLMNLAEKNLEKSVTISKKDMQPDAEWVTHMENYRLDLAADYIWKVIGELDAEIAEKEPFKLVKTDLAAAQKIIAEMVGVLNRVAVMLAPFMPETSAKILEAVAANKKPENLFARAE